jgi:hypothetical protein
MTIDTKRNLIGLLVFTALLACKGPIKEQEGENIVKGSLEGLEKNAVYDYSPQIRYDQAGKAVVTIQNYQRAETHYFMKGRVDSGMFGKIYTVEEPITAENQKVVRANGDVLFSYGILDLTSPAKLTMPENEGRFMELRIFNEDHYLKLLEYEPGTYTLTKENMNTRYIHIAIRILADVNDPQDMEKAHALQQSIVLDQKDPGSFEIPDWDMASLEKVRKGLSLASSTILDSEGAFGDIDEVEHRMHLAGTALGWGGAPAQAAKYIMVTPPENDGKTAYELRVKDEVPVDGFWSATVYNAAGYFEKNELNRYSVNNVIAKRDGSGYITIRFGGDPTADNYIPITQGWNYTIRLYRARPEILNGHYKFPEATRVK